MPPLIRRRSGALGLGVLRESEHSKVAALASAVYQCVMTLWGKATTVADVLRALSTSVDAVRECS
jgi:hypothetical protein